MIENTKKIFLSIGFTLNELKKSFFISYFLLLILFGLTYLFSTILIGFYKLANESNSGYFILLFAFFFLVIIICLFTILNKIKKITLLKVIDYELKFKDKKLLSFLENSLDKEFKLDSKENIKRLIRVIITIVFALIVLFFVLGIIIMITNLVLKTLILLIFLLFFGPFLLHITRYVFYVYSMKELVLSYRLFVKEFDSILLTFLICIIPVALLVLLFVLFSNSIINYILLFLFIFVISFVFYFNFYFFSFIYLQNKAK